MADPADDLPGVVSRTALTNTFLGDLIQVCIATRDHRRTLAGLVRLGIGPWTVRTFDKSNLSETTYRGKPAEFSMKVCLANSRNMNWEIIEPLAGPSIYADFLERHGDGVQHLAFNCDGVAYEERLLKLRERGCEAVQTGVIAGRIRFQYFAAGPDLATIVEVFDIPPGASLPPVEAWYPAPPPG